jgi:hypothetical protein
MVIASFPWRAENIIAQIYSSESFTMAAEAAGSVAAVWPTLSDLNGVHFPSHDQLLMDPPPSVTPVFAPTSLFGAVRNISAARFEIPFATTVTFA